jgi:hypothetical protein
VRQAVIETCTERPSFGYRRVTAMVRRKLQFAINTKQVRRIMRQEKLLLKQPRRPPRQRIPKEPGTLTVARPDEVWHMDAMYVFCGPDRWVLAHNIVDACTSEWVGFLFDRRYRKEECIRLLEQTVLERWPQTGRAPGIRLRMDNHFSQTCDEFVEAAKLLGFWPEYIHKHQPEMTESSSRSTRTCGKTTLTSSTSSPNATERKSSRRQGSITTTSSRSNDWAGGAPASIMRK